jgi:hypothetical protein
MRIIKLPAGVSEKIKETRSVFAKKASSPTLSDEVDGNVITFRSINKINLLLVTLTTLALRLMPLMRITRINAIPDNIGSYLAAARLAGLDWSSLEARMPYYGQGYYIFFAPLFRITDNPYTLWLALLLINAAVMTLFGIIIYYIAIKYCKLPDKIPTVFIAAFCSSTVFVDINPRNEVPIHMVIWLTALLIFIAANSGGKGKVRTLSTIGLLGVLFWGIFIHTRLEVMIIIIAVAALVYFLLFRYWFISPLIFYPGIVACNFIADIIHKTFSTQLLGGRDVSQMGNADLRIEQGIERTVAGVTNLGINPIINTVISNTNRLILSTYGLAAITMILVLLLLYSIIKSRFISRIQNDEKLMLPRDQTVVMLIFAGFIVATIFGIYIRWGNQINQFFTGHSDMSRWWVYSRYYLPYYGPLIPITIGYAYKNADNARKICIISFILFVLIYLYVDMRVIPLVESSRDFLRTGAFNFFNRFFDTNLGFFGTGILIMSFFALYYFLLYIRKPVYMLLPVFALLLSMVWYNTYIPYFRVTASREYMDTTYKVLKHVETTHGLPNDIFSRHRVEELQFLLNRYRVIIDFPSDGDDDTIFVGPLPEAGVELIEEFGFTLFSFPNHDDYTRIWVRGDSLKEAFAAVGNESTSNTP